MAVFLIFVFFVFAIHAPQSAAEKILQTSSTDPLFSINGNVNAAVVGTSGTGQIFRMLEAGSSGDAASFRARDWRVVARSSTHITAWMVGPYRNAAFNPANSNVWANNQLNLDGNLTTYLSPFPASVRDAFISHSYAATANTNVGGWNQTNPAATGRMVLPSMREIMNSGTWGLTQATRAAANNGFHSWAWLRSANAGHSANVAVVAADGTLADADAGSSLAVRPVVHIAVTALASNVNTLSTLTGLANGTGSDIHRHWHNQNRRGSV